MNKKLQIAAVLTCAALSFASASNAAIVYSQGFESGTFGTGWSVGDSYYSNCGGYANCVVTTANWPTVSPQAGNYFYWGATGGGGTPSDHRFFISDSFAVTANTDYNLRFYLADQWNLSTNQPYTVPVLAKINGTSLGGVVKAATSGWNQIDLSWNSGSSTSAVISLFNEYQLSNYMQSGGNSWGYGNDFAVDSISLSSVASNNNVPEPATLLLAGLGLFGFKLGRRRTKA